MYKFLTKYGQWLSIGVSILVVGIFLATSLLGLSRAGYTASTDLIEFKKEITAFDIGLWLTVGLLVIAILIWVVFAIYQLLRSPKNSLRFVLGGAFIVAVFAIFYFMTNLNATGKLAELVSSNNISDNVHRLISGGLSTSIALAGLTVLVMIVTEFVNIFK